MALRENLAGHYCGGEYVGITADPEYGYYFYGFAMIIQAGQRRFCERRIQHGARQRGVTLILALLCVFIMSVIAAGLMFSTQAEVWSSANYRYVTQSRYVAEAGAEQAINWLQNYLKNSPPNFGDTTKFDITTFPAQYAAGSGSGTCPTNTA